MDNDILDTLSLWIGPDRVHSEYYLQSLGAVLDSFRLLVVNKKKNLTRKICISERRKVISNLSFLHRLLRVASLRNLNRTRDIIGLCSGFQILFELFPLKHISSLV